MNPKSPFEPQRGGIEAGRFYGAPMELAPAKGWWGGGYKDNAPPELGEGVAVRRSASGNRTANQRGRVSFWGLTLV